MKKKIGLAIVLVVILMIWSAVKELGINDLEVNFKEVHFVRNENNTGPVIRRYLVTVSDTLWSDLERYGDLMPYTKLGSTEVFFIMDGADVPASLALSGAPFDESFDEHVIAQYTKNNMGQVNLKK